ncbi:MAG: YHYH protein [Dehalococcoidia bacterium]|nr:YHYH protein [Dehalococcoidia bacterium]
MTLSPSESPATTPRLSLIETDEPASDDEPEEPVATTETTPELPSEELVATPEPTPEIPFEELIATPEPTPSIGSLFQPVATPTRATELIQIDYASEEWDDVWLCGNEKYLEYQSFTAGMGTDVEISRYADLTPDAYGETWPCSVFTAAVFTNLWIYAAGTPNHDFESTLGCCAGWTERLWTIPLKPKLSNEDPVPAPERGAIAVTVTGVAIYGPEEGPGGDAVASEYGYFEEDRQPVDLGVCGGHSGPKADEWALGGEYHYHYDSNCMHLHDEGRTNMSEYVVDVAESVISKVVGFAFDGFPIYGTYEVDSSGETIETTSSFRLKDGKDGYGGIDDYEFIEGIGTLDECNGHFGATPEVPEGIYHYHSTLKNGDGDLGFPYFPLCYKGVVNEENYVTHLEAPYGFWDLVNEPGASLLLSPLPTMCLSNCGDPFMDRPPGGFIEFGPG